VLYELLTGKRTFDGKTITETLGAIIHKEPEWKALPNTTPWRIQELLRRCLTKDAHDRLRDIAHVRVELNLALYEPAAESPTGVASAAQPAGRLWAMAVGLVVLGVVIASLAFWLFIQPSSPEQSLSRFVIRPSPPVVLDSTTLKRVSISPDGRQLVYLGVGERGSQLYLRSLDDFVDRPIPGTEGAQSTVFFSPDGESIGFFAGGKLKKTSLAGGSPITLCDAPPTTRTGDWFEDTIVFTATLPSGQGLYRVSANGGEPEMLATVNVDEGELAYILPDFLPDGKDLLFTIRSYTGIQTALLSLETGERKLVLENARQARYLSTGDLVYEQWATGNLMVVPFDLAALEVTGDSVPVVQGVRQSPNGFVDYAISDNGTLVYGPSTSTGGLNRTLVWVDRKGQEEPLAAEPQSYQSPRISPDGSRLAITIDETGGSDIWIYDLEREILTRLTFDPAADHYPVWTPDGRRIVFDSGRAGAETGHNLFWKAADGTGQAERLTTGPNNQTANSFSPDGMRLVFLGATTTGLQVLSMEGERTSQPLFQSQFGERQGMISPDGHWIAYDSNESGRVEVYVRPFPNVEEGKWQISRGGGASPVWGPNGRELFFRSPNGEAMMVVGFNPEPTFTPGSPVVLFTGEYTTSGAVTNYDISPDGQRFLMIKEADEEEWQGQINVITNWFEELKRLAPTN